SATIRLVDASGTVDTSRTFGDAPANNFRSATSDDGAQFWVSVGSAGGAGGPRFYPWSGSSTTEIITNGNTRVLSIFGGRLFASSASATPGVGISDIGALPTTSGSSTVIAGAVSGTGTPSPYGIQFFDLDANSYAGTGA